MQVVYNADYLPFGSRHGADGDFDEKFGFTGKEYDPDTGLYYFNARWYDSELGRFISADPVANPNLYTYCNNNPLVYTDPDGRNPFLIAALVGGLFGGIDAVSNGQDFWSGFAIGAIGGSIGYGFGQALAGTALADALGPIGTQALTGGLTSGTMSVLMGGDFWDGAGTGAISGGVSAYLGKHTHPTGNDFFDGVRKWFNKAFGVFAATGKYEFRFSDAVSLSGIENTITEGLFKAINPPGVDSPAIYPDNGGGPSLSEAADIADDVYTGQEGKVLSGGWTLIDVYSPKGTGLRMGVYARVGADGNTEYVIANKGTSSLGNWGDNIKQFFGASVDMKKSVAYATAFVKNHPDADITFVGHSKGGAEAAANAVATKKYNAILFNPASVNLKAIGLNSSDYRGNMTAYIVKNEPLNFLFGGISKPIDNVVYLPQQSWNPLYNHSMAGVKKAISEWEGM